MKRIVYRLLFLLLLILIGITIGVSYRYLSTLPPESTAIANQEDFDRARDQLESALAKNPEDLALRIRLAELLYNYNNYDTETALKEALEHYQYMMDRAIKNPETDPRAIAQLYFYMGNIDRVMENFTGAIATFEKGLEYDAGHAALKYNIAYTYLNDFHDPVMALDWLHRIGEALDDDPAYHYNLARAHYEQGNYAEAEKELDITMNIDPNNAPIVRADLYRRVLEAQGRELPADADIPSIEATFHIESQEE